MGEKGTTDRGELFSQLLVSNRHRIYGFIYSLLQDHTGAEDLMQEVSTILWRKFDQFEEGTDFAVWAMAVARYCSLNWRRKQVRLPLPLEDDDLMRLADEAVAVGCQEDERQEILKECMAKLPEKVAGPLIARYHRGERVQEIAARQKRSVRSIYLLLERAHGLLLDCVNRHMRKSSRKEGLCDV